MDISIWKMFTIFGIVSGWAAKALADGKVTLEEAIQLVTELAGILGIPTEIEVPGPLFSPGADETAGPGSPETAITEQLPKRQPLDD